MQLSDQTLVEFAILMLTGIIWSTGMVLLVMDYRGFLTSYTQALAVLPTSVESAGVPMDSVVS